VKQSFALPRVTAEGARGSLRRPRDPHSARTHSKPKSIS
jgi:hypothetical protein